MVQAGPNRPLRRLSQAPQTVCLPTCAASPARLSLPQPPCRTEAERSETHSSSSPSVSSQSLAPGEQETAASSLPSWPRPWSQCKPLRATVRVRPHPSLSGGCTPCSAARTHRLSSSQGRPGQAASPQTGSHHPGRGCGPPTLCPSLLPHSQQQHHVALPPSAPPCFPTHSGSASRSRLICSQTNLLAGCLSAAAPTTCCSPGLCTRCPCSQTPMPHVRAWTAAPPATPSPGGLPRQCSR